MNDDLHNLLKIWEQNVPVSNAFQRNVWNRIGASRPSPLSLEWLEIFFSLLARPQVAALALGAVLVAGAWLGSDFAASNEQSDYLRTVNPYARQLGH